MDGYNINVLRQTACLVVYTITADNIVYLFNWCQRVGPQTLWRFRLKDLHVSIDETVGAWSRVFGQANRGLTVGFLLLRY